MRILTAAREVARDSLRASLDLYKIMIPLLVAVKLLQDWGLVRYLAEPLGPVMGLAGLPARTGLVWATAVVVNPFASLVVLADLLPAMGPLTTAQATVLATMILICHNLPVELGIAKRCGASAWGQGLIRAGAALACGVALHHLLAAGGWLSGPAAMVWQPQPEDAAWGAWALGQARKLGSIFFIILALMGFMRLLDAVGVNRLVQAALRPVLRLMGIGPSAATVTVIGLTLGFTYGGGLIIAETRSGRLDAAEVFPAMTLMGLAHSLIEDTLLMMLMGGHLLGTFWFRLAFSLAAVGLIVRVWRLWRPLR